MATTADGLCGSANGTNVATAPTGTAACSVGVSTSLTVANNEFSWTCLSLDGGSSQACTAYQIVNGACGSSSGGSFSTAPTTNLCSAGTPAAVSGTGPFSWFCNGINTGTNAACTASLQTPPTCALTATPPSIAAGDTSTLTASCSPAATTYVWSANTGFGSTVATGKVSPKTTTTYSVTGSNEGGSGNTAGATVTVKAAPAVLTVAKSGTGSGTVSSGTAGINCGPTCGASFPGNTNVALTATPATGSTFAGWSGACTGAGTCTVAMDAAKSVGATFNLIPFATTTTKVITGTTATITNTITFNASDVGKTGAVYVTAWVSVAALKTLGVSEAADSPVSVTSTTDDPSLAGAGNLLHTAQGPLSELDAAAFVLVQLTSTGWQLVVNGQLIPYASGVLGDQLKAQAILQHTDITNLAGAQFCLGYGTSAADMSSAGRIQVIATLPESTPTSASAGTCLVVLPQAGVWWNTAEGGRGYVIEQQGSSLFFGAFLYESIGRSTWYAASGTVSGNSFNSTLTAYSKGQTLTGPYVAPTTTASPGTIGITFSDASHGTLTWPGGTIPIQRFDIVTGGAAMTRPAGTPESGIWWNPVESGRGFALEIQNNTMFLGGYMYDASGNPIWYSSGPTPMTNATTYTGTWEQYGNGQTLTGTYNPATLVNTNVGTVRIQFSDTRNATLTLPDGRQISITRFRF